MNIIIVTHNKYLELGLKILLGRHSVTIGDEYFIPESRNKEIPGNVFIILCDTKFRRLMSYMFNGHKFHLLPVELVSSTSDIYNCIHGGNISFQNSEKKLTMNEMVILFYYIFHGNNIASISYLLGISSKTVYSHIYRIKQKNGISGLSLKYKYCYERSVD